MTRRAVRLTRFLAVAAAATLVAVFAPVHAEAAPGLATRIVFTGVFTPSVNLPNSPGVPDIWVTQDRDFSVTADFVDDSGQKRAAYLFPARANLYVDGNSTPIATQEVPASATSVRFDGLRLPEQNGVRLRMTLTTLLGVLIGVREGFSDYFDVQRTSVVAPFSSNPTGIGNGGGTNDPCEAPPGGFCSDLVLNNASGVRSDQIGSFGFCQATDGCLTGEYAQALVDLDPAIYNRTNPLKLLFKCHPTLCDALVSDRHSHTSGGGHNGGSGGAGHAEVTHLQIVASLLPDGPLALVDACQQSGRVPSGKDMCVDYAAAFKDELTGNWIIPLLARDDIRGSIR